jgi:hypothetical protein
MIRSPKATLIDLPPGEFYLLSFLIHEITDYGRTVQQDLYKRLTMGYPGAPLKFVMFLPWAFIVFVIISLLLKVVVRLFRKRLSVRKVMNIWGYSHAPLLVLALLIFLVTGDPTSTFVVASDVGDSPFEIVAALAKLYAVFLLIWGFCIVPGEGEVAREAPGVSSNTPTKGAASSWPPTT